MGSPLRRGVRRVPPAACVAAALGSGRAARSGRAAEPPGRDAARRSDPRAAIGLVAPDLALRRALLGGSRVSASAAPAAGRRSPGGGGRTLSRAGRTRLQAGGRPSLDALEADPPQPDRLL